MLFDMPVIPVASNNVGVVCRHHRLLETVTQESNVLKSVMKQASQASCSQTRSGTRPNEEAQLLVKVPIN